MFEAPHRLRGRVCSIEVLHETPIGDKLIKFVVDGTFDDEESRTGKWFAILNVEDDVGIPPVGSVYEFEIDGAILYGTKHLNTT